MTPSIKKRKMMIGKKGQVQIEWSINNNINK
jgi:hypothetical protein